MPAPVDVARLREFSDGMPSGLASTIDASVDDVREAIEGLNDAVSGRVPREIGLLAHRAGGACAGPLARQLFDLEEAARAGIIDAAPDLLTRAAAECHAVAAFLQVQKENTNA